MGNIETPTKFSELKSISNIEDDYSFTLVSLQNYKRKLSSFIEKKVFIETGFKEI